MHGQVLVEFWSGFGRVQFASEHLCAPCTLQTGIHIDDESDSGDDKPGVIVIDSDNGNDSEDKEDAELEAWEAEPDKVNHVLDELGLFAGPTEVTPAALKTATERSDVW